MATVLDSVDREIQVAGSTCYPENKWREAILTFLFALWRGDRYVCGRPKIHFGCLCLRLDAEDGCYFAYGKGSDAECTAVSYGSCDLLEVGGSRLEVESALIRFVKNKQIKVLVLRLRNGIVVLWKKDRRGQYGCWSSSEIPRTWNGLGSYIG